MHANIKQFIYHLYTYISASVISGVSKWKQMEEQRNGGVGQKCRAVSVTRGRSRIFLPAGS